MVDNSKLILVFLDLTFWVYMCILCIVSIYNYSLFFRMEGWGNINRCISGENGFTIVTSDWSTWIIGWAGNGHYRVECDWIAYSRVGENGDYVDGEWNLVNLPWFPHVLREFKRREMGYSYRKKCVGAIAYVLKEGWEEYVLHTIKIESQEMEEGKVKVNVKEYFYINWRDLWGQLKDDGFSLEDIWTKCKEVNSDLTWEDFYKIASKIWDYKDSRLWKGIWSKLKDDDGALSVDAWTKCKKMNLDLTREMFCKIAIEIWGYKESQLWKALWSKLKDDGILPEDIWIECQKMNPNLTREIFLKIALRVWNYRWVDLQRAQDRALGEKYRNDSNDIPHW